MKVVDGKVVAETPEEEAALKGLVESEVSDLKSKRDELLGKLKALDAHKDIDPAEYKTLKEQAAKAEEERAMKAGEFERLRKKDFEEFAKKEAAWQEREKKLTKTVEDNALIAAATSAIAAEKGSDRLLMPHVRSMTKLDENFQPVVIDEAGNIRFNKDNKPMSIKELIAEMKSDVQTFGRAFEPSGASGSGSQGSNANGTANKYEGMSPTERMTAARAAGQKT